MPKRDDRDGPTPEREREREPEREPEPDIVRSPVRQPPRPPAADAPPASAPKDGESPGHERQQEPETARPSARPSPRPQPSDASAKLTLAGGERRGALTFQKGPWQIVAGFVLALAAVLLLSGIDEKKSPPLLPPPAQAESVPDEIVVDLVDSVTDAEIAAVGQAAGVQLRYNSIHSQAAKIMVAKVPPAQRAQILTVLRQHPLVEAAEPQFVYRVFYDGSHPPNDPGYAKQWHLKMLGLEEAWKTTRGKGAVVAVIDSGVAMEEDGQWHQAQDLRQTTFVKGYDFVNHDEHPQPDHPHGTHVASTIAESTDNGLMGAGVAPEATIMPLKVMGADGSGKDSDVADGIHFAADHGAQVINMSLGGAQNSRVQELACQYAYNKGVTLVCAAGNTGKKENNYPASYKECISVSAVGPQGTLAPYSTWSDEVDIAAPGGDESQGQASQIWQNTVGMSRQGFADVFYPMVGTSMASPHVAGVAALLVSLGVKEPAEVREALRRTAKPRGPADQYGAGVLDAAAAVKESAQGGRQFSRRLGLAAVLSVLGLGVALGRWKELGRGTSLLQFALPLAAGLCAPDVLQFVFGFGSRLNMLGHSVLIPIVWLNLPNLKKPSLRWALAVTVGLTIHLLMDARSGVTPFAVLPPWRVSFWLYANAAVGAGLLFFAFQEEGAKGRERQRSAAAA